MLLETLIPLKTVSETNVREHWTARHRRRSQIRRAVAFILRPMIGETSLPCIVRITRLAPSNGLDDDNLVSACKPVRDGVADALGVDDRTAAIRWQYSQARGKAAIKITIEKADSEKDNIKTIEVIRSA